MEKELFDWENWDELSTCTLQFYNCSLRVPVGQFSVGTKFETICLSFEEGVMTLYPDGNKPDETFQFKLKLSVGEQIN